MSQSETAMHLKKKKKHPVSGNEHLSLPRRATFSIVLIKKQSDKRATRNYS